MLNTRRAIASIATLLAVLLVSACSGVESGHNQPQPPTTTTNTGDTAMSMKLTSAAFDNGGMIPKRFTCDGENLSPAIAWSGVPAGTESLALICDDPDAPSGVWVHWVAYNIPADVNGLPEDVPARKMLENKARQGTNDFHAIGYGGPCPPGGTHRYVFKLYALDEMLTLGAGATKAELLEAMSGHIIGQAELMGRYERRR